MVLEDLSVKVSKMVGYPVSVIMGTLGPLVEIPMSNGEYGAESLKHFLGTKGFAFKSEELSTAA